jgi:hypothetical protein
VETFIAYFDVSGHPDNTEILSVAGYLAQKDQWDLFEKRWQKILRKFGVSSLHMKHFAHSIGEFESWKNDEAKRKAFLSELIRLIVKTARHSFATSLYLPDYLYRRRSQHPQRPFTVRIDRLHYTTTRARMGSC